ncbi:adenylate kinase-domain-containing protein [Thamnocephalis sphaerospora]|uniref:Adenylate kinase-domain-containing protein n=1 Tax=Thamnocephalis sphaerospora TaxID=78915 RepID=A0A4P9XRD9_9FUNG|nr:adenylate kinase-domain-containing protein [Thamnocephalis sphaerospora]|eukprot:RKP08502.1 adenylate kinase-domain-containing protein [Thamnocephalis sphaerospora]
MTVNSKSAEQHTANTDNGGSAVFCASLFYPFRKLLGRRRANPPTSVPSKKASMEAAVETREPQLQRDMRVGIATDHTNSTSAASAHTDAGAVLPAEKRSSTGSQAAPLPFKDSFIVFVLGGPGSGKGTQSAILSEELQLTHISMGDLLRQEVAEGSELGEEITAAMREGLMVTMDITRRLLLKAMTNAPVTSKGFLLDGFPR